MNICTVPLSGMRCLTEGTGKDVCGLPKGFQVEGWVRGVGLHSPALSGGMLLSQVSVWSVVWGTLPVPSRSTDRSVMGI